MKQIDGRIAGTLAALAMLAACGGSPSSPSGSTVIVKDGGATGASGATITITAAGVSPSSVTVAVGQTVTFVNNDNRPHEMASNPHPQHGSCPSIEGGLGSLGAGQTRTTRAFGNSGSCGFHDHLNDTTNSLKGTITVQ